MSQKIMLIYVSSTGNGKGCNLGNNNKFYYIELKDNDDVFAKYGRVGTEGTTLTKTSAGLSGFNKLVKSKKAKGYVEVPLELDVDETQISTGNSDVMMIALSQIQSDQDSKELIKKLVNQNIHNITSNTKITFNVNSGLFKTPLGVVTKVGVNKALEILNDIAKYVNDDGLIKAKDEDKVRQLSESYYAIIPTTIDNLRPLNSHIYKNKRVSDQYDICNALLQSLTLIENEKESKISELKADNTLPKVFNTALVKLNDAVEFTRVSDYFEKSKNQQHGRTTSGAKVVSIYKINIESDDKAYRGDLPNQMELWHGTKVANILSILKSGLLMPKYSPGSVTGYMFGQGLYFSNQSSKSLNYCDGMYWNSSSRNSNKIYMFVADIAMGNYQVPKGSTSKLPDTGYDSYWAQPGKSGIMNDEMIVFKNEQIRLKYLLEIEV